MGARTWWQLQSRWPRTALPGGQLRTAVQMKSDIVHTGVPHQHYASSASAKCLTVLAQTRRRCMHAQEATGAGDARAHKSKVPEGNNDKSARRRAHSGSRWALAGHNGLHEEAQHGEHGQAAILDLLDLQLPRRSPGRPPGPGGRTPHPAHPGLGRVRNCITAPGCRKPHARYRGCAQPNNQHSLAQTHRLINRQSSSAVMCD